LIVHVNLIIPKSRTLTVPCTVKLVRFPLQRFSRALFAASPIPVLADQIIFKGSIVSRFLSTALDTLSLPSDQAYGVWRRVASRRLPTV
jgi:hypothetical protein